MTVRNGITHKLNIHIVVCSLLLEHGQIHLHPDELNEFAYSNKLTVKND